MNYGIKIITLAVSCILMVSTAGCERQAVTRVNKSEGKPMELLIIVGSVRHTGTGNKIATSIKAIADKRPEVTTKVVDIASFKLPDYTLEISPATRKGEIKDPVLKKWSDTVKAADGYIVIAPVYNYGYPGPLKNALDSLYTEWNGKPIGFVGYSGGPSGGASMIAQLRDVAAHGLEMVPVATDIKIPQSWKAFTKGDVLATPGIETELNTMIDQLLAVLRK